MMAVLDCPPFAPLAAIAGKEEEEEEEEEEVEEEEEEEEAMREPSPLPSACWRCF